MRFKLMTSQGCQVFKTFRSPLSGLVHKQIWQAVTYFLWNLSNPSRRNVSNVVVVPPQYLLIVLSSSTSMGKNAEFSFKLIFFSIRSSILMYVLWKALDFSSVVGWTVSILSNFSNILKMFLLSAKFSTRLQKMVY